MQDQERKRLSQLVRLARGARSQRAFGAILGVSSTAVQHWENGLVMPSARHLQAIASQCGYTLDQAAEYIKSGKKPDVKLVDEVLSKIHLLSKQDAGYVAKAALDRVLSAE